MSFVRNWNYITSIAAYPCAEPDPIIWFTTFLPAAAPAIIDFISYGCRDIVKFKAGMGQPCGRIFAANAAKMYGPKFVDGIQKSLKFARPVEAGLFWFFVADLISDTQARWTSLAYELSGCRIHDDEASWQQEGHSAGLMPANTPVPVGGIVINEKGQPGIAWPTGAIVPRNWYVQGSFELEAVADNRFERIQPMTWIRSSAGGGYDFPAHQYPPGSPGQKTLMSYTMQTQVPDQPGGVVMTMMAMSDVRAVSFNLKGTWTASKNPILNFGMNPLGCLRDLTINDVSDPAGRNAPRKIGSTLINMLPPGLQANRRGPTGGLPRSKK